MSNTVAIPALAAAVSMTADREAPRTFAKYERNFPDFCREAVIAGRFTLREMNVVIGGNR